MATTRLVVALALACAIDASVETERVDALGSGELAHLREAYFLPRGAKGGCVGCRLQVSASELW